MPYCRECAFEVQDDWKYCPNCNFDLLSNSMFEGKHGRLDNSKSISDTYKSTKISRKEGPNFISTITFSLGLILLITSTFFDEWLVAEIDTESVQGSKIQVGLTDFVFDCSSVEDQEEMRVCKAFIDSLNRDMTSEEYVEYISMKFDGAEQSQINKYFDDLPEKVTMSIDDMCRTMDNNGAGYFALTECADMDDAGFTAILLSFFSLSFGIIGLICIIIFVNKKSLFLAEDLSTKLFLLSGMLSISAFITWLAIFPEQPYYSEFGVGYYLMLGSVCLIFVSILIMMYWRYNTLIVQENMESTSSNTSSNIKSKLIELIVKQTRLCVLMALKLIELVKKPFVKLNQYSKRFSQRTIDIVIFVCIVMIFGIIFFSFGLFYG